MNNRTKKSIKERIKELEHLIQDTRNYRKNIPKYEELEKKLQKLRDDHYNNTQKERVDYQAEINTLNTEMQEMDKAKQFKIPDKIQQWFNKYKSGVDWGYGGIKIKWVSEDKRFVIITCSGSTGGQGTSMGTGGYYYSPSESWLADINEGERFNKQYLSTEGRLTKARKQEMIDYCETLRNKKN